MTNGPLLQPMPGWAASEGAALRHDWQCDKVFYVVESKHTEKPPSFCRCSLLHTPPMACARQKTIEFFELIEFEANAECLTGHPGAAAEALEILHHRAA